MTMIKTPAMASIERGDIVPDEALRHADRYMQDRLGIDPLLAFVDPEINRQHRAVAMGYLAAQTAQEYLKSLPDKVQALQERKEV